MTYCVSDAHGEYDLFMRLLDKIKYSDSDRLIVCGDFIDKGKASVCLTKTIFSLPNSYCIMENHEYLFFKFYRAKMRSAILDYDAILWHLRQFFAEDGNLLDWDVVDILTDLPYYIEDKDFLCVHAGAPIDKSGRLLPLNEDSPEELVYDRKFKEPDFLPQSSKCVIFGHTPTTYITANPEIIKYPLFGCNAESKSISDYCKIHIDTGTPVSGVLGCFCVDDCSTVYVKKDI